VILNRPFDPLLIGSPRTDPLQCRQVMPGAPHRSVHVGSKQLYGAAKLEPKLGGAGNLATTETRLKGTDEELAGLFSAARGAFETLVRESEKGVADAGRTESVRNAVGSEKATDLTVVLRRHAKSAIESGRRRQSGECCGSGD
jgi:hypothetical protein